MKLRKILQPLGLKETAPDFRPPEEKWAHGYMLSPDEEFMY